MSRTDLYPQMRERADLIDRPSRDRFKCFQHPASNRAVEHLRPGWTRVYALLERTVSSRLSKSAIQAQDTGDDHVNRVRSDFAPRGASAASHAKSSGAFTSSPI